LNRSERTWQAIDATATDSAREAIEYGLMEAGAVGTESSTDGHAPISVRGYFENTLEIQSVRAVLLDALRIYHLPPELLIDLRITEVPDRDWLAEWKKNWQPVEVGRFIIAPPWIESESPAGPGGFAGDKIIIRIEPGMAFGTGTHETTRLCLKAIEKYFQGGSFLDVGTGTGVLAIAAAKICPIARVEGLDTDADAISIAKENAQINDVLEQIDFHVGSISDQTASAELVCANLTAATIVELLPLLLGATCGHLVLSGILDSQIDLIQSRLFQLGAPVVEMAADGEWVALVA